MESLSIYQQDTNFNKRREVVGSKAFNLNLEHRNFSKDEIQDHLVSYLGEYRFGVERFNYNLLYSEGHIRDPYQKEAMVTTAKRSVVDRLLRGEPIHREEAEVTAFQTIDDQLRFAQDGSSFIWASPPGPKEEGYGDYGFIFKGKVKKNGPNASLQMEAVRVEKASIHQYNKAMSALTGIRYSFSHADEFLASPIVLHAPVDEVSTEKILQKTFTIGNGKKQQIMKRVMQDLDPLMDEITNMIRFGTPEQKKQALRSIENFAIQRKQEIEAGEISVIFQGKWMSLGNIMNIFNYEPPKVAGSCGSSSENQSNNPLSLNSSIEKILKGDEYDFDQEGPCVVCSKDVKCGPCKICRGCDTGIRQKNKLLAA